MLSVQPGDVVAVETDDFAGGQITRSSTAADLLTLDFDRIYPLAGPIHVDAATVRQGQQLQPLRQRPSPSGVLWAT